MQIRNVHFPSTFPMFVPSLSWQNDRFDKEIGQNKDVARTAPDPGASRHLDESLAISSRIFGPACGGGRGGGRGG
eukprot:COSAG06_NODE_40755_length_398_cov_51.050167_2_plen_74_part_01